MYHSGGTVLEHMINPMRVACLVYRVSLEQMGNLISLVVAAAALAIAVYSWITASRAARNDVLAQVREWSGDVVDLFAAARRLCELDDVDPSKITLARSELRFRASALLDRGRFFFPNWDGARPQILALVMIAYELMPRIADKSVDTKRLEKAFDYLQSVFVSTVKQAVNFSAAPATVKKYEVRLSTIQTPPLPLEISKMRATHHASTLAFDNRQLDEVPPRDPTTGA